MTNKHQRHPERYGWLPSMAVNACMRLARRHGKQFQEAGHFMIDVAAFLAIMSHPQRGTRRTRQDLLDGLTLVSELKVLVEHSEERLLRESRRRGITFREIADAMALQSRQAAEQRFLRIAGGRREAEQAHMNRRRQKRFGYVIDAQDRHESHLMNLQVAFRVLSLDSAHSEEIEEDSEGDS
ncbi:hypothetical protein ACFYMO_28000 [Streptomyces sp. NPDC007025]|uniref:hypothetical protein n=1 Tax=Streptomyces sp. NPDC007025 TaxID=3364771 RepID=UPI0036CF991F